MDDLELQRLEAVADAARAVRALREGAAKYDEVRQAVRWLDVTLDILDKGREVLKAGYAEYDNGPWVSMGSDSCVDVTGYWHFPGPDVTGTDETKLPIRIVPLKQGFVVQAEDFLGYEDDGLAFTDALDLAEWLLGWLGFEEEAIERVWGILSGKIGLLDELSLGKEAVVRVARSARGIHKDQGEVLGEARSVGISDIEWQDKMEADHQDQLGVAEAAQAYVDSAAHVRPQEYRKLVEAVKKWRGIEGD